MAAVEVIGHDGDEVLVALDDAVDALLDRRLDDLGEMALQSELVAVERIRRRLHARVCAVTAAITSREAARARQAHPRDPRVGERAAREAQQELAGRLGWTPSEAKEHRQVGEQLARSPEAARAARDGELTPAHARVLQRTLKPLIGNDRRVAEERLLAVAGRQDATTFARTAQQVLAELDARAEARAAERRHQRRRASLSRTADGMTALYAELAGMDAELVETGIGAFRRPDAPDEHRTPEQRTADALVELTRAALAGAAAPTQHGVRPHVVLTVAAEDLRTHDRTARDPNAPDHDAAAAGDRCDQPALVTFGSGRRELLAAVRRYLDDAGWSWLVVDPDGVPIEAGPETRTVPVALWRGLVVRDGGCIADGCDARAEWCDVMHLDAWHRDGGRLTLDTAALGCRFHHRKLDHDGWVVTWIRGRPVLHHADRPPRHRTLAGPDPGG